MTKFTTASGKHASAAAYPNEPSGRIATRLAKPTTMLLGLTAAAAMAWCSFVLPFHSEPHYRSSRLGEFIVAVLEAVDHAHLSRLRWASQRTQVLIRWRDWVLGMDDVRAVVCCCGQGAARRLGGVGQFT